MNTKIILDFETSGLNPYHDDIIVVAMKVVGTDEQFVSLLRPKSNEMISQEITSLTGITNKMLKKEGNPWAKVYESMNAWLGSIYNLSQNKKITIISHNGKTFDFIFLKRVFNELTKRGIKTVPLRNIIFIDTLLLARRLVPGRMSYRQNSLCQSYNICCAGNHRALNDIIALEALFCKLCDLLNTELNKRRNVEDDPQMIQEYIEINI